jgi:hypothetical protein
MPHGVGPLQSFIKHVMDAEVGEIRSQRLYDYDFTRLYRALVQGVGTIAGCFHCLAACPVGHEPDDGAHEETNAQ